LVTAKSKFLARRKPRFRRPFSMTTDHAVVRCNRMPPACGLSCSRSFGASAVPRFPQAARCARRVRGLPRDAWNWIEEFDAMMMDMSGMSIAMMLGMGVIWLLVLAFLILGIAAFVKYLRS
jgi:hypothetical protein